MLSSLDGVIFCSDSLIQFPVWFNQRQMEKDRNAAGLERGATPTAECLQQT
jgi:hypothetical protein